MQEQNLFHTSHAESALAVNKVIKNTYMLLAMTLAFSALTAYLSRNTAPMSPWLLLGGFVGLSFLTQILANSVWGLVATFAFTGFVGFALGPILNVFMQSATGSALVMQALGGTAIIFFALSGYALVSRKDFSFLQGFLFAGAIVLMVAVVASLFLHIPALQLAISAGFMLFSSAVILFQTGAIIHGGERNYIVATVTLYASIYNIFISLLNILSALNGNDR